MTQADYENEIINLRREYLFARQDARALGLTGSFQRACWLAVGRPQNMGPTDWVTGARIVLQAQVGAAAELQRQAEAEAAEAALHTAGHQDEKYWITVAIDDGEPYENESDGYGEPWEVAYGPRASSNC